MQNLDQHHTRTKNLSMLNLGRVASQASASIMGLWAEGPFTRIEFAMTVREGLVLYRGVIPEASGTRVHRISSGVARDLVRADKMTTWRSRII